MHNYNFLFWICDLVMRTCKCTAEKSWFRRSQLLPHFSHYGKDRKLFHLQTFLKLAL